MTLLRDALLALALPVAGLAAPNKCGKACETLAYELPNLVTFPSSPDYVSHNSYWSARQSSLRPACFVSPQTTGDVAKAVQVLTRTSTPFTVKAGGHTAFEGGSNIGGDGVTVDLGALTEITVSADRQTVSVGAGNRWIDVYSVLDPLGLAVVGGRSSTVGVSGLTLGGGISYFSGARGWACDNVRQYVVVLSSGAVVTASATTNPDLYWALRGGGGSNFGIVTRFDLVAFEQGNLWASANIYPGAANASLIPLVHDLLTTGLPSDPAAHTYFVLTHVPELGGFVVLSDQFHATHADLSTPPAVFAPFHNDSGSASPPVPPLLTNTRLANVSRLSLDIEQAGGLRQTWWDTTVRATSDARLLQDIVPLFAAHANRLLAAAAASSPANTSGSIISPFLVYQPISTNILEAMQVNGGNALGLYPEDGAVMIVQLTTTWADAALDRLVEESSRELIDAVDRLAAQRGAQTKNGFVYMNYAGKGQDVYRGYGKENRKRLREVARKFDRKGKFKKLWKGYFKL